MAEAAFSLADLASLNTDEIATLTSRLPEPGIFVVRGVGVKASESNTDPEKPPLYRFGFESEILAAELLDKTKDAEKFVGRKLNESYTLWPDSIQEAIGLLKGRYQMVLLPNTGIMGGVEGHDPGWLDGIVGHIFRIRVRRYTTARGEQAGYDWLPTEEAAAAAKAEKDAEAA